MLVGCISRSGPVEPYRQCATVPESHRSDDYHLHSWAVVCGFPQSPLGSPSYIEVSNYDYERHPGSRHHPNATSTSLDLPGACMICSTAQGAPIRPPTRAGDLIRAQAARDAPTRRGYKVPAAGKPDYGRIDFPIATSRAQEINQLKQTKGDILDLRAEKGREPCWLKRKDELA